ncbi:O-antigen ligase family protein [Candidatus Desantisbacteria bacterium]|nr:O-antigen ligase family protein [Candidatus Desantisbacteria bacterium]
MEFSIFEGITFTNSYLALGFILVLFIIIWKHFEFGLALFTSGNIFLNSIFFNLGSGRKGIIYPLAFYVIMLFGYHLLTRPRDIRIPFVSKKIVYLFGFFIFIVLITYFLNPKDEYSLGWRGLFDRLFPIVLTFMSGILLSSEKERLLKYVNCVFILLVIITVLYGIAYLVGYSQDIFLLDLRNVPIFSIYMGSGSIFALICAVFCIIRASSKEKYSTKVIYLLLLLCSVFIVFISLTRIYILAFFIVLIYMLFSDSKLRKKIAYGIPIISISFVLVVYFFMGTAKFKEIIELSRDRIEEGMSNPEEAGAARFEMYEEGWKRFKASPVIGLGAGNSGIVTKYIPSIFFEHRDDAFVFFRMQMHSFYLEILYEQGILGAVVFLIFLFHIIKIINLNRGITSEMKELYGLKLIANSIMIIAMISGITGNAILFYWSAGLILAVHAIWKYQIAPEIVPLNGARYK